ncbi:MAG: phage holin family protein [Chitinophagaceae bacterium]
MFFKFLGKILVSAFAAIIASYCIRGVHVNGGMTPIILAIVLALLNGFVKPVLVFLTIPISVLTLGLFLIVINIIIVLLAANIVKGFQVDGWWNALLFSIVVSIVTYLMEALLGTNPER